MSDILLRYADSNGYVSGPGIDELISTVKNMKSRGAPVVDDYTGFNKMHYNDTDFSFLANSMPGRPIPIDVAVRAVNKLATYKKRQLSNYDSLRLNVQSDINKVLGNEEVAGSNKVVYKGENKYRNILLYIARVDKLFEKRTISAVQAILQNKYKREGWKLFSEARESGIDVYQVNPMCLEDVLNILREKKYDVSEVEQAIQPKDNQQPILRERKVSANRNQNYLILNLNGEFSKSFVEFMKSLPKQRRDFDPATKSWTLKDFSKEDIKSLIKILDGEKFNTNDLTNLLSTEDVPEKYTQPESEISSGPVTLKVTNVTKNTGGNWHVAFSFFSKGSKEGENLNQVIKFLFPDYGKDGQRFIDTVPGTGEMAYLIKGSYNQYRQLSEVLKKYGFDVSEFNKIAAGLVASGDVEVTRIEGDLEGYQDRRTFKDALGNTRVASTNNYDKFLEALKEYERPVEKDGKIIDFKIYDKQKEGIAFLYGRQSALLGDSVGVGKCKVGTSYVQTSLGNFQIQDIWNKFSKRVYSIKENEEWGNLDEDIFVHSINEDGKVVKDKVVNLYREKFKGKLVKYKTDNGKETVVTKAHKFLTERGWRNNLLTGDYICSSSNQFSIHEKNNIKENLGYLMGWQISEGCEIDTRVSITQSDISILEEIVKKIKNLNIFKSNSEDNINPIIKKDKNTNQICLTSVNYRKYLESLGYIWGRKSKNKEVPEFIMNSSDDVVKVFLKAFFDAEGSVRSDARGIEVSSASEKMIYQISLLLQRFNIFCVFDKMMKCATNGTKIKRPYYRLKISGSGMDKFISQIGFSYKYKMDTYYKFKDKKHNYNKEGKPAFIALKPFFEKYNIPIRLIEMCDIRYALEEKWMNSDSIFKVIEGLKRLKNGEVLEKYKQLKKSKWTNKTMSVLENINVEDVNCCINSLEKIANNDLQYEKIISVEEIDFDGYIYDLSIENNHNYISDNLICHNTVQLILAADMRMKNAGGNTIIITLVATQDQWIDEIARFAKHNPEDVSTDPSNLATWNVYSYHAFQRADTREQTVKTLQEHVKSGNIQICIMDECHSIKNTGEKTKDKDGKDVILGSNRTYNIQNIVNFTEEGNTYKIPFCWGASATMVANRPVDVYNQLKAVNHPLSELSYTNFAITFGAMVKGRWGWEENEDIAAQVHAATKLKEWLLNFKVYSAKSKKDIRADMPENKINKTEIEVDINRLYPCIEGKLARYKNPELPVSVMVATRDCIASSKVPYSLEIAKPILNSGKKVMVFTAFRAAAEQLAGGLKGILGDSGNVVSIVGGLTRKKRAEIVKSFKDPNSKDRAIVLMIAAGGTGLDFPNVTEDVIENDFDWTPASNEQMRGRAWRISSNKDINTHSVVAKNSEDSRFRDRVDRKMKIAETITVLTQEQLDLFSLGKKSDDEKQREIEKQLIEAVKEYEMLEVTEGDFIAGMAHEIESKIQESHSGNVSGNITAQNKNWYKQSKTKHNKVKAKDKSEDCECSSSLDIHCDGGDDGW